MLIGGTAGVQKPRFLLHYTCYGRTLSERPCYILPMFFYIFFIPTLVGQTAERIFTKLSHVVNIRCYLRTY